MLSLMLKFTLSDMKRLILLIASLMMCVGLLAQNDRADNIVGIYSGGIGRDAFKASIEKAPDGTFRKSPSPARITAFRSSEKF